MTADKTHGDIEIKQDQVYKETFDSALLAKLQKVPLMKKVLKRTFSFYFLKPQFPWNSA